MLDWLHWGGQLIFTGGAGQSYSLYRDSFLGPYLPAERPARRCRSGRGRPAAALAVVSAADVRTRPSTTRASRYAGQTRGGGPAVCGRLSGPGPDPAGAEPAGLPLGAPARSRVRRPSRWARRARTCWRSSAGSAADGSPCSRSIPTRRSLLAWPGLDTLVRRVILRRPEEPIRGLGTGPDGIDIQARRAGGCSAAGPDLVPDHQSRLRARTMPCRPAGDQDRPGTRLANEAELKPTRPRNRRRERTCTSSRRSPIGATTPGSRASAATCSRRPPGITHPQLALRAESDPRLPDRRRAAQLADLPVRPESSRVGLGRRPPGRPGLRHRRRASGRLRHGLRLGLRRDRPAGDSGDYPRAHLTRLASLYTTGRSRFTISYPNDPTALALPLDNGRSIRGEDVSTSIWQSSPVPALSNFRSSPAACRCSGPSRC